MGNAALDALTGAFASVDAVLEPGIPLMIGITAIAVAANWALRMIRDAADADPEH